MSRSRAASSVVGSPVLLGAITMLVVIVAVFLAYNANQGLPFVPTYNIRVEAPSAANLVEGNEVRVAGYRVGAITAIRPRNRNGQMVALMDLKLEKVIEPLPVDTQVVARPRSVLGLKFLDLKPGTSAQKLQPGATLPVQNSDTSVEFDDLLNTFDAETRRDNQTSLAGFGDAFAGRGQSINIALQELPELFEHLTPVMDTLNDRDTRFDEFFENLGEAAAEAAPVARIQADLFTEMADTFEAFSASPPALQETISRQPPLYQEGIEDFPFQRAFLANFADLSNRLRPGADELDRRLPTINAAIIEGARTNRRLPILNRELEGLFEAIDHLAEDPNTLLALKDLTITTNILEPLLEYIAPYSTVCNGPTYFFTGLGDHISEVGNDGTAQRVLIKLGNEEQDDKLNDSTADRPVDISKRDGDPPPPRSANDGEPHLEKEQVFGTALQALHAQPYQPGIDRGGRSDCQAGQNGYIHGPLVTGGRYPESSEFHEEGESDQNSGGNRTVADSNTPGRAGPTFTGVPSLQDVDRDLRR
jgi:virulence factor Mce-like protein